MRILVAAACASLAFWTGGARAQTVNSAITQASPFDGFKVGGTVDHRRHEAKFDRAASA